MPKQSIVHNSLFCARVKGDVGPETLCSEFAPAKRDPKMPHRLVVLSMSPGTHCRVLQTALAGGFCNHQSTKDAQKHQTWVFIPCKNDAEYRHMPATCITCRQHNNSSQNLTTWRNTWTLHIESICGQEMCNKRTSHEHWFRPCVFHN